MIFVQVYRVDKARLDYKRPLALNSHDQFDDQIAALVAPLAQQG